VEEVDLRWIQTSWARDDCVVDWGNGSDSGFSWDFVGFNLLFEGKDWSITEDECDLVLEDWSQDVEFRDFSSILIKVAELLALEAFDSEFDDFLDQSLRLG
jgi:hypothetical protein